MAARLSALRAGRILPPGFFIFKDSWYSFLLEAESNPGPQCCRKDYVNLKNPPHRDLNPRPSGLQHSALTSTLPGNPSIYQLCTNIWTPYSIDIFTGYRKHNQGYERWSCIHIFYSNGNGNCGENSVRESNNIIFYTYPKSSHLPLKLSVLRHVFLRSEM
jgi:hypothetical protein